MQQDGRFLNRALYGATVSRPVASSASIFSVRRVSRVPDFRNVCERLFCEVYVIGKLFVPC